MKFSASTSLRNAPGSVLPPRSRITTTTLRLPLWFSRSRRSRRFSLPVCRPYMAAEKCTVDFRLLAFATDRGLANLGSHRLADFVRQDESGFVLRPEIAA